MEKQATNRPSATATFFYYLAYIALFAVCGTALWMAWGPRLVGAPATSAPQAQPTPIIRVQPQPAPVVQPIPGVAQNEATATAQYNQAVRAAEPVPNTGQAEAPAVLVVKPAAREPAGDNVPTAEPVADNSGMFGSKQKPVDIQSTHACKHGQVWIDGKGCRNP